MACLSLDVHVPEGLAITRGAQIMMISRAMESDRESSIIESSIIESSFRCPEGLQDVRRYLVFVSMHH